MYDKVKLKNHCISVLKDKLKLLMNDISEAQDSSNDETKSTAGDKHETSRAMAQLEVERLSQQLESQENILKLLQATATHVGQTIQNGSIVMTDKGIYYLSAAIGMVRFENTNIMTIGMNAPISQLLLSKKKGDTVEFNGNKYYIEEIF